MTSPMRFALCGLGVERAPDEATAAGSPIDADVSAFMPRSPSSPTFVVELLTRSAGVGAVFAAVAAVHDRMGQRRG